MEIKNIIRDKLLFDLKNPAIILCDNELEKVFNKKAIHVAQIRGLMLQHLELVEEKMIRPDSVPIFVCPPLREQEIPSNPWSLVNEVSVRRNPIRAVRQKQNKEATEPKATTIKIRKIYKEKKYCKKCNKTNNWTVVVLDKK